jgi:uncharacterized repeat protein (TIGR01451 family)
LLAVVVGTGGGLGVARDVAAASLPSGFQETVVFSGLVNPTVVRFASDGRVFVAEKSGRIKVFDNLSDTTPTVFADLRTNVHDFWDRGLLGLALDPAFPTNPYVYVLYAYDHILGDAAPPPRWGDTCPNPPGATGDGCVVSGRLSRLQAAGNVMTGPEQVLIEDWCQQYPSHSVGSLAFGSDGALYVSAGDGASFNFADYGQDGNPVNPCGDPPGAPGTALTPPTAEGGALRSQDLRTTTDPTTLDGAVLRVDPATGAGLPDNPFASSPDPNARRIIAYGLRNPFRIATRPGTSEIWAGDVGWSTWEELNRIAHPTDSTVENFGWPCYEGAARQGSYDNLNLSICENLYAAGTGAVTAPFYTYRHSDSVVSGEACANGQGSSTVGMAFYQGGSYPSTYNGALFFADYSRDCLWVMPRGTNGLPDPTKRANFLTPAANPVHLEIGPGGDLFYVDFSGGTIRRIQYIGANQPPTAVATATPTTGAVPLAVSFDGRGSFDPEGGALTYAWDLDGDGAFDDGSGATASFTYQTPGTYSARLRVTDAQGATGASDPITIQAANTNPVPSISSPTTSTTWRVGDTIAFSGSATDAEDGTIPASGLRWDLILKHCPLDCHEHPLQTFDGVPSGSFVAPDHEYPSRIELRLTATDRFGASTTIGREIHPQTIDVTMASSPSGLSVTIGGTTQPAPYAHTLIVGSETTISAPDLQDANGVRYAFQAWSDGGARSHAITAGTTNVAYTATYVPISADVAVSQTATVTFGQVTFAITTRNNGPTTATAVQLSDPINRKLTFVNASAGCSYASKSRTVTCSLGSLANGATVTTTIVASYGKGRATLDNTVTVSSSTPDPVSGNNSSRVTFTTR